MIYLLIIALNAQIEVHIDKSEPITTSNELIIYDYMSSPKTLDFTSENIFNDGFEGVKQ